MMEGKICSVCNIPVEEAYCSRCGQKITGKKITTLHLITDFFHNFFSLEKSALATILRILTNPKPIVINYFLGYKNFYASPGKILLYSIAVIALHIAFVDPNVLGMVINVKNVNTQYFFWLMHIPVVLLVSWLAFIRLKEDLVKHIISVSYIAASGLILFIVINDLIILVFGDLLGNLAFLFFLIFSFVWNGRVFGRKTTPMRIAGNTLIQIGIYVVLVMIMVLLSNNIRLKV